LLLYLLANPNDYHFNAGEGTFIFRLGEEVTERKVAKKKKLSDTIWNGNSSIQQEEGSFYEQIRLKMTEETSAVLHFEHISIWC
jgi:hypothetical protein